MTSVTLESGEKLAIYDADPNPNAGMSSQSLLPLEPICVFVIVYVEPGKEKTTSDSGERARFHVHRMLAI